MENRTKRLVIAAVTIIILALLLFWLWRGDVSDKDIATVTGPDPVLEEDPESRCFVSFC